MTVSTCFFLWVTKNIIHRLVQEILLIKKSCNLLCWGHFGLNLEYKNFLELGYCSGNQYTRGKFTHHKNIPCQFCRCWMRKRCSSIRSKLKAVRHVKSANKQQKIAQAWNYMASLWKLSKSSAILVTQKELEKVQLVVSEQDRECME